MKTNRLTNGEAVFVFIVMVLFATIALSSCSCRADGFFVSTAGSNPQARTEAVKCFTRAMVEATPLEPTGWKESVLDVSLILRDVGRGSTMVSTVIAIPTFPIYHAMIQYDGAELGNLCMITVQQTSKVLHDYFKTKEK
jgi:hypothetical protein